VEQSILKGKVAFDVFSVPDFDIGIWKKYAGIVELFVFEMKVENCCHGGNVI
jgi:hypothetical protein